MTLIELADAYARNCFSDGANDIGIEHPRTEKARTELVAGIEALQAENERLKINLSACSNECAELEDELVNQRALTWFANGERDALAAKLATLEADAERLDYLQQGVTVELLYSGLAPKFRIGGHIAGTSHDLRAAIDAAKGGQHEDA